KLRNRALQVTLFAQFKSFPDMMLSSLKARLVQANLVVDVMGIRLKGFYVIIHGRIVVLDVYGTPRRFIVMIAMRAARRKHTGGDKCTNLRPSAHELSGTSSGDNPWLGLPMESSIGLHNPASRGSVVFGGLKRSHVRVAQPFFGRMTGSRGEKGRARQLF